MLGPVNVRISTSGIDVIALKKLSLVSHALADRIGGEAGREQRCLAGVLDDLIRKIELGMARPLWTTEDQQSGGE